EWRPRKSLGRFRATGQLRCERLTPGRRECTRRRVRSPEFAAIRALWLDKTSYCFFRAHQCKASAGTRKKNTSTTRSSMKNIKTNLPNSFSSILKKCVAHETAVFQSSVVAAK